LPRQNAQLLEPLHPPPARRGRQVHGSGQLVDGPVAALLQQVKDFSINGINFVLHGQIVENYSKKIVFRGKKSNFMLSVWWQTSFSN
jgi:hypothetical protein